VRQPAVASVYPSIGKIFPSIGKITLPKGRQPRYHPLEKFFQWMDKPMSAKITLPRPGRQFVQTDRATHEAWAKLIMKNIRSAQLMHVLCAQMDDTTNAVVITQKTLANIMGCSVRTVRNALSPLIEGRWLQVVQLGHAGTVNAYIVNSAVGWTKGRDELHLSAFHARVIADAKDQNPETVAMTGKLRTLPLLYPPEEALPAGEGEPGAQVALPGFEPVLHGAPRKSDSDQLDIEDLTRRDEG